MQFEKQTTESKNFYESEKPLKNLNNTYAELKKNSVLLNSPINGSTIDNIQNSSKILIYLKICT